MAAHSPSRSKQKKELHKLAVARSDVFSAQKTCRLILERVSGLADELYAPLFYAAVVSYGRPFVDNKSTGALSRHWSDFSDHRLRATHNKLLKTRHELVAHSDSSVRAIHIIPPGSRMAPELPPSADISLRIESYYYPQQMFIDTFDTCANLIGRLNGRIDVLLESLYGDRAMPTGPFPLTFDDGL